MPCPSFGNTTIDEVICHLAGGLPLICIGECLSKIACDEPGHQNRPDTDKATRLVDRCIRVASVGQWCGQIRAILTSGHIGLGTQPWYTTCVYTWSLPLFGG